MKKISLKLIETTNTNSDSTLFGMNIVSDILFLLLNVCLLMNKKSITQNTQFIMLVHNIQASYFYKYY